MCQLETVLKLEVMLKNISFGQKSNTGQKIHWSTLGSKSICILLLYLNASKYQIQLNNGSLVIKICFCVSQHKIWLSKDYCQFKLHTLKFYLILSNLRFKTLQILVFRKSQKISVNLLSFKDRIENLPPVVLLIIYLQSDVHNKEIKFIHLLNHYLSPIFV